MQHISWGFAGFTCKVINHLFIYKDVSVLQPTTGINTGFLHESSCAFSGFLIVVIAVIPTKLFLDFTREKRRPRFGNARLKYEALHAAKGTQCIIVS